MAANGKSILNVIPRGLQTNTARLGETSAARVQSNFALIRNIFLLHTGGPTILYDGRVPWYTRSILIRVNGNRHRNGLVFRESIDKRNSTPEPVRESRVFCTHRTSAFRAIFASVWRPIGESRKPRRSTLVYDKALVRYRRIYLIPFRASHIPETVALIAAVRRRRKTIGQYTCA